MNILGLVFSLLLILSYGFYASWEKHSGSVRLRSTYLAHQKANRLILNRHQSQIYKNLRSKQIVSEKTTKEPTSNSTQTEKNLEINSPCAKLNLTPLIQEGREAHPLLYELSAKLLRTFYAPLFPNQKRFEYKLLNAILSAAKAEKAPVLEKLSLNNFRLIYYKMLKGTKEVILSAKIGYPSLLDYFTIGSEGKICLIHAHPDLLTVLFNEIAAQKFYTQIHQKNSPPVTKEWIETICNEAHITHLDPALFELLELDHPHHQESKKTFVAQNGDVFLRKTLPL